jgi:uncharacterized protein YigE (DUF2233 family)
MLSHRKAASRVARKCVPWLIAAVLWSPAHAVECSRVDVDGKAATACRIDVHREDLRLFLTDASGRPLQTFAALEGMLAAQGKALVFAMNAGMFHADYSPVGLFVDEGRQLSPVNVSNGAGNFFLKPNGVFFVGNGRAGVIESSRFAARGEKVSLATQSGPLLVEAGIIHPLLRPTSTSRLIRNGVGVDRAGRAIFVISDDPVSLHELARLFRDGLSCPDALYFDGVVSSVRTPRHRQSVQRAKLGPIIAVIETQPRATAAASAVRRTAAER